MGDIGAADPGKPLFLHPATGLQVFHLSSWNLQPLSSLLLDTHHDLPLFPFLFPQIGHRDINRRFAVDAFKKRLFENDSYCQLSHGFWPPFRFTALFDLSVEYIPLPPFYYNIILL